MAERQDASRRAGALPATFSAAGLFGGVLFASPARNRPQTRHLLLLGTAFKAGWVPLLAPLAAPAVLTLAVLPGALFVPLLTAATLTVTTLTPPGTSTEAVGWMSSAIRLGLAGGTALASPLGGHFAIPLLTAVMCAILLSPRTTPAGLGTGGLASVRNRLGIVATGGNYQSQRSRNSAQMNPW
ncbi:hypothetical protein ACWDV7_26840 [Streptomyces sp. NPDC003362]